MTRRITIELDLDASPTAITDSIRAVLESHNLVLVRASDTTFALDEERSDKVLREMGRNAAQAVVFSSEPDSEAA